MSKRAQGFVLLCVASVLTLLIWTGFFGVSAIGKEQSKTATWEWSADNPKPDWWKWDDIKKNAVRGGYLQSSSSRYIGLMNPNHWPVLDWVAITYMYGGLVYIDGKYQPQTLWLAKSVEYTDPVTSIMKLREGITFHDGSDFNAEAVKYTIDYIKDKKNGAWSRSWCEPIASVEVLDEFTLKWNFKRPWAGFLGMMATVPGYIISKKALEGDVAMKALGKVEKKIKKSRTKIAKLEKAAKGQTGEKAQKTTKKIAKEKKKAADLEKQVAEMRVKAKGAKDVDKHPVGTGRMMFEEGKPGNYLKLKRNPNWWFGRSVGIPEMPHMDGVMITIIPDDAVRLANLRAGKLDWLGLTSTQYMDLKDDPKFNIASQIGNHMGGLKFNHMKGPAMDIRVRKAVSHAIDRKALVVGLYHGQAIVASGPYHATHWCHNPELKPVTFDPELSKKYLKEAGYEKGLTLKGHMGSTTGSVTTTEAIKAMLAKVGINWKVDALDAAASSDRDKNIEYDLAGTGWGYIKEPDMLATGLYHPDGGFNYGRTNNPEVIKLIEAGKKEIDMKKRRKIYWELERVLYNNYEDVWISYPIINTARNKIFLGYDVKEHKDGGEFYWFTHPGWFKDGKRQAKK
jgi:peptide/nickel transport system substrate-binding protein